MNNGSEPAMPVESYYGEANNPVSKYGFTKREVIAMAAMQGLCVNNSYVTPKDLANEAVLISDALLKALEQPHQ